MLVVRHARVGAIAENTYLVGCSETGEAVIVDPGGETARVAALREPGGFRVTRILLTHGHFDHIQGAAEAKELFDAPISIHPGDRELYEGLQQQLMMFGFDDPGAPPPVDHLFEDGEVFQIGKQQGRVIHTPGHTQGGCCFLFPEAKVIITGDTLFTGSIGRTDLPGGDLAQIVRSLRERVLTVGDDVRFYPGHGPDGLIGDERKGNPYVGVRGRISVI
jgi:glyoxylase-like metal-dependent hydrolase (beta-lactamase superfamily II)